MSGVRTQLIKEARVLFTPWCLLMVASLWRLSPALGFGVWTLPALTPFVFCLGVPILATLSFGSEFQHGTITMLLSQPVERKTLWKDKTLVLLLAILPLAYLVLYTNPVALPDLVWWDLVVFLVVTTSAAGLWTLVAGTSIGGVVLDAAVGVGFVLLNDFVHPRAFRSAIPVLAPVVLYSVATLWLGYRALLRLQTICGSTRDDITDILIGPRRASAAVWLRSRPTGPLLNLIRKEIRLLAPAWLIWAISLILLIGFVAVGGLLLQLLFLAVIAIASVVSGGLSMGEESLASIQAWERTLPVRHRQLWFIKLFVAVSPAFVMWSILTAVISTARPDVRDSLISFALIVPFITFAAFWCATVTRSTVPAALSVLPVIAAMAWAFDLGYLASDIYINNPILRFLVLKLHPYPFFPSTARQLAHLSDPFIQFVLPLLLIGLVQSYRLFRAGLRPSRFSLLVHGLPAAVLIFTCGFLFRQAFDGVSYTTRSQELETFRETAAAIDKMDLKTTVPLLLKGNDIEAMASFSSVTARWLEGASIVVRPQTNVCALWIRGRKRVDTYSYTVTLQFPNKMERRWFGPGQSGTDFIRWPAVCIQPSPGVEKK